MSPKKKIIELVIARESAENIVELIVGHTMSSHMHSIAATIGEIVNQAGEGGYVIITGQDRVSTPCECGCGRMVKQPEVGRKRKYYNDGCRTRGARKRAAYGKKKKPKPPPWSEEEESLIIDLYSVKEIANKTGRSENAIRSKREQLRRRGVV